MKPMRIASLLAAVFLMAGGCADDSQTASLAKEAASGGMGCDRFHPGGRAPEIIDERYQAKTRKLCYRAFAVMHSGVTRSPLWVAEQLTREGIRLAYDVPRFDQFHVEERLPRTERAELEDYSGSGYDRGHMAPDGDMPSREASAEAFTLANMAPQARQLNRGSWARLESSIRRQTRGGDVYVVTGPLYQEETLRFTHRDRRLPVPTHVWKAVYAEGRGATVFIATNEDRPRWSNMTVEQFAAVYGIDPFPGIPAEYRTANGTVTSPAKADKQGVASSYGSHDGSRPRERLVRDPNTGQWMTEEKFRLEHGRAPRSDEYSR